MLAGMAQAQKLEELMASMAQGLMARSLAESLERLQGLKELDQSMALKEQGP